MNNDNQMKMKEIQLIEIYNNGNKIPFELLSTIEINKTTYYLLTPFDVDEATGKKLVLPGVFANVFVMEEVDTGNGKELTPVTDVRLMQLVFDLFIQTSKEKYKFQD